MSILPGPDTELKPGKRARRLSMHSSGEPNEGEAA
jgi:hypothetical protein